MARAAAKRGKGAKQAARGGQRVAPTAPSRRRPEYENQLFFGRIRGQAKWVFVLLAVIFALSFAFLGVGSGGGALTDLLNGNIDIFGGSSGTSVSSLENKVKKHPNDSAARVLLAQELVKKGRVDESIATLNAYLARHPKSADVLNQLTSSYESKAQQLTTQSQAIQSAQAANDFTVIGVSPAIGEFSRLGQAIGALASPLAAATSLQAGQQILLAEKVHAAATGAIGAARRVAAQTPADSSAFLRVASVAQQVADTSAVIDVYKTFLKRYPKDLLAPDVRRKLKQLETSGSTSGVGATSINPTGATG